MQRSQCSFDCTLMVRHYYQQRSVLGVGKALLASDCRPAPQGLTRFWPGRKMMYGLRTMWQGCIHLTPAFGALYHAASALLALFL